MRLLAFALLAAAALTACPSGKVVPYQAPVDDAGVDDDAAAATCTPSATCLTGTIATPGFSASIVTARVSLFKIYPAGTVDVLKGLTVVPASDGSPMTWSFTDVPAWDRYYVQVVGRFDTDADSTAIEAIVGPIATATNAAPIDVQLRPLFAEVFQEKSASGDAVDWASVHVYDPSTGVPLSDATVTVHAGTTSIPLQYGASTASPTAYYGVAPKGTASATAFTVEVDHPAYGDALKTSTLTGEVATAAVLTAPPAHAKLAVGAPLDATWAPTAWPSFITVDLYADPGGHAALQSKYTTGAAVLSPDTNRQTIPGSALTAAGAYALDVDFVRATCTADAAGCVYSAAVATVSLTVQ